VSRLEPEPELDPKYSPLRFFNVLAIPLAVILPIFVESFWRALAISWPAGVVVAGIMGAIYISRFRALSAESPLWRARAELMAPRSLDRRFVIMQAISGGLIQIMWTAIAFGIRGLFRTL